MKSALTSAAWIGLALSVGSVPSLAQLQDNSQKTLSCGTDIYGGDRARHCEMRELPAASVGRLNLDASPNGGVTVKGWLRGDTLVRARVEASGDTESAAALLVSQVSIDTSGGQVRAMGPDQSQNHSGWSVSYEVFVPQNTDLTLKSHNGGLAISDVRGQIHFEVMNGGVHLKRVAGDVSGSTTNGGIDAELTGQMWDGRQMEISTKNGGVNLTVPSYYSAHVQAETNSGGIHSDFPMQMEAGNTRPRRLDANLGSGGALIHVSTVNGQVSLKRSEAQ
ncbi:MAG TPA: DUF4097 family beta strand repeat-containing protein [Bryobacteraceae bacterium]|nr:DUF4097 family beta strand repeat-containing protein [Bryobacteraceae bacterium]